MAAKIMLKVYFYVNASKWIPFKNGYPFSVILLFMGKSFSNLNKIPLFGRKKSLVVQKQIKRISGFQQIPPPQSAP
jgi:hypothetical protein